MNTKEWPVKLSPSRRHFEQAVDRSVNTKKHTKGISRMFTNTLRLYTTKSLAPTTATQIPSVVPRKQLGRDTVTFIPNGFPSAPCVTVQSTCWKRTNLSIYVNNTTNRLFYSRCRSTDFRYRNGFSWKLNKYTRLHTYLRMTWYVYFYFGSRLSYNHFDLNIALLCSLIGIKT